MLLGISVEAQSKKWTLSECVEYAQQHNIAIKQSELDIENSKINKEAAFESFLPTLNANASHSWNIGLNQNITTGLLENQTSQFSSVGLNSGITIYNGLLKQKQLRRAALAVVAAQYQLSKMKDDISLNVANAFLQILFNKERFTIQKESVASTKRQLQRTEELVKAGALPKGDLLDVKANLAANEQAVTVAENSVLLSKLSLAQLLQLKEYETFEIADSETTSTSTEMALETPSSIFEKAKQNRIELKIAKTNLDLAEKDIRIAQSNYQPSIQGFYSFTTRASYSDRFVGIDGTGNAILAPPLSVLNQFDKNKGHSFGAQMNIPILNGFSIRNQVARSKIAFEKAKNNYTQQELDLERNIYTAFTDAKGALKSHEAALQTLEARNNAYGYAKERFNAGMMNVFDLNQAQTLVINAQSEVARTKYDAMFKQKILEFYFGIPLSKK